MSAPAHLMWFRKRDNEIEMEGMRPERERKEEEELIETDYQPFNWKKFFLSPKYIRKAPRAGNYDAVF